MRLGEFIEANIEPILVEWEAFARSIWPAALTNPDTDSATVRDDAEAILRATVADMTSEQSVQQQSAKSKGNGAGGKESTRVVRAATSHGAGRVGSGFQLDLVVAEYRALRASVLRLWRESAPTPDLRDLEDVTRFNESIDQSLTEGVRSYMEQVKRDRDAIVAEERASRSEAEAASRSKDIFLAMLSHELRTPLNAIVGWMNILRTKGRDEADITEGLEVIERSTKAQVQLIDDVLDVARIVSGKLRVDLQPCDLIQIINAGVDTVRPAAAARGITITLQLDPSANHTSCDGVRVQQIVWNLVSNAVKFTPKGGEIRVSLGRERSSIKIEVSDTGQGINPALLPYVFDRFRQADSTAQRRIGGLGLGLSIAKYLVEAHGGAIEAHSAGEGKGATFIVRLPIRPLGTNQEQQAGATRGGEHQPQGGARAASRLIRLDGVHVFLVDDEADARRVLVKLLERVGAVVTAASSAAEALQLLPKNPAHVLISDIGMPDEDGLSLLRKVRKLGYDPKDLPAIALTAYAHEEDARRALEAGFQVHVTKPVDPHRLTSVIASLAGLPLT